MQKSLKTLSILLVLVMLLQALVACNPEEGTGASTTGSDTNSDITDAVPETTAPAAGDTLYNIIFALATIPPVLAALDCIDSGNETYAIIERGKTYNGIDSIEYFHNAGFDINNNLSQGFTETEFNAMVDTVKKLKSDDENAFFYFYAQDGTALKCAAIAANAGLSEDEFHIYMCEDGTGAYISLYNDFVKDKTVNNEKDEVYTNYMEWADDAKEYFDEIMSKTDNKNSDEKLAYHIGRAYALASLPNFTYYLQDEANVVGVLENTGDVKTKLLSAFGADGYNEKTEFKLNLKYQKISEGIAKLDENQKKDYLTLMYGSFYEDTYAALTRGDRADKTAPADKLVFIGSRHTDYPNFASDAAYGIGGLDADATLPESYAQLDAKYKTALLFATEDDYKAFLEVVNNAANYTDGVDAEAQKKTKVACFNLYIDYIYTLKLTYALYGEDYDIIMKGHPREAIGSSDEWGNRYKVSYGENKEYVYDKLLDQALLAFHEKDSTGKYIGMVPYGTAAENLAYLGADIAIAGLPSSTYSGYDLDVDVLFILAESSQTIADTDSQVKERYEAGNLTYTDASGETKNAVYYNIGNVYKAVSKILTNAGDTEGAKAIDALFASWLSATHAGATDINDQGFAVKAE